MSDDTAGPADGTIDEVLARVADPDHPATAQAALDAEQAKGDAARSTLVAQLTAAVDTDRVPAGLPAKLRRLRVNVNVDGVPYGPDWGNADKVPDVVAAELGDHVWATDDDG